WQRGHDDAVLVLSGVAEADLLQFADEHAAEVELPRRARVGARIFARLRIDANVTAEAFEQGTHSDDTPIFAQGEFSLHWSQFGLRALQTCRPWRISIWLKSVQCVRGSRAIRSCSTFTGSVCFEKPSRRLNRPTCVSTVTPGVSYTAPRTTFAVF